MSTDSPVVSIQTEQEALGIILGVGVFDRTKARAMLDAAGLSANDFSDYRHGEIFKAVDRALAEGRPTDDLTLATILKASGVLEKIGGPAYLMSVGNSATAQVGEHLWNERARAIKSMAVGRTLLTFADTLRSEVLMGKRPEEVLAQNAGRLALLAPGSGSIRTANDVMLDVLDELEQIDNGTLQPTIETGMPALDNVIGGFKEFMIIGADPGTGKSGLLATWSRNLSRRKIKHLIFSLEDAASWMLWRWLSAESKVSNFVMKNRRLTAHQKSLVETGAFAAQQYGEYALIDDRSFLTADQVVATAKHAIVNLGVQVVLLDHLGEMDWSAERMERFDLNIAQGLGKIRRITKEHRVPVAAFSHLKQAVQQEGRKPMLTDFPNAAAMNRMARVLAYMAREPGSEQIEFGILKQNNGKAGLAVMLKLNGPAALVTDDSKRQDLYGGRGDGPTSEDQDWLSAEMDRQLKRGEE